MSAAKPKIVAVIMAGGKGSRLGELGQSSPKCLLPLPEGESLLARLLLQLRDVPIDSAMVCCSPENHSTIERHLEEYRAKFAIPAEALQGLSCSSCCKGPNPALAEIISRVPARWYLLCLADIYFAENPFGVFARWLEAKPNLDGCLLNGFNPMTPDGAGSGFIAAVDGAVHAISYKPFGEWIPPGCGIRRWSGLFLFRSDKLNDPRANPGNYHSQPYENWIMGLLQSGARCQVLDAAPFVNVNSVEEYRFLLQPDFVTNLG